MLVKWACQSTLGVSSCCTCLTALFASCLTSSLLHERKLPLKPAKQKCEGGTKTQVSILWVAAKYQFWYGLREGTQILYWSICFFMLDFWYLWRQRKLAAICSLFPSSQPARSSLLPPQTTHSRRDESGHQQQDNDGTYSNNSGLTSNLYDGTDICIRRTAAA